MAASMDLASCSQPPHAAAPRPDAERMATSTSCVQGTWPGRPCGQEQRARSGRLTTSELQRQPGSRGGWRPCVCCVGIHELESTRTYLNGLEPMRFPSPSARPLSRDTRIAPPQRPHHSRPDEPAGVSLFARRNW